MSTDRRCRQIVLAMAALPTLARTKLKQTVTLVTTLLVAVACLAQDRPQLPAPPDAQSSAAASAPKSDTVTIPATTRFALVLTNPISSRTTRKGDEIYAQTTAPVIVGDRAVIPPGTFVQGKVDKLMRNGSRAEMLMSSVSVVFPDGYVVNIAGPLNVESDEGTAWLQPSKSGVIGAIAAPAAGLAAGLLIGRASDGPQTSTLNGLKVTTPSNKGMAIGSIVGSAAGATVGLIMLMHSHQFFVDVGSPMRMTLPQPLTLSENQVADEIRQAQEHPVAVPMPAPRPLPVWPTDHGTCYTPDTPGTPPTIIPGTPSIGDSPGTPDIVIPGTPSIPGTPYPCP